MTENIKNDSELPEDYLFLEKLMRFKFPHPPSTLDSGYDKAIIHALRTIQNEAEQLIEYFKPR